MGKTFSAHTLLNKEYETIPISEEWVMAIGEPEIGFTMIIYGDSGSGKTTFCIKLAKELSNHGKVYYNSCEQGESRSLQKVCMFCNIQDVKQSQMMFGDRDTFEEMLEKLKKNRAKFVFIDSLQYANLTTAQYKLMIERYPKKSFIIISWSKGGKPKGEYARAIEYMVDIKCVVHKGTAKAASRFGHTEPYKIFDAPQKVQQGQTHSIPFQTLNQKSS